MGGLNPTAEEFRPRNPNPSHGVPPATLLGPTHSQPYHPNGGVQTVSFFYGNGVVVPHPQTQLLSTSSTRSLLVSLVPCSETVVSESLLRRELEVFGDVRGVQMELLREGMVTVHFYDLRHAETALTAINNHHHAPLTLFNGPLLRDDQLSAPPPLARGLVAAWAQYILPASDAVPDGHNQGTVVVFNLDSEVDDQSLRKIFEAFGPVKEFRHTPSKKNQRFVEFYDIRDAANALKQMNGKEIHGKPVVVKFSRPGKFFHAAASTISESKFSHSPPPRKFWPRFAPNATTASHFSQSQLAVSIGSHHKTANPGPSIGVAMASIRNGVEERHSRGPPNRNFAEKHSNESAIESTKHQQPARSRHWRGKQAKKHETRFLIKEDAVAESAGCIDSRTTVMIKNIPNKYSQKLLMNMLDSHCIHCNEQIGDGDGQLFSSYDFVYLPIDFNNKCNVGYGFVNMTSPEATLRLYKAFHLQPWEVFNSRKICEVTYARVQGLEALKEHFKSSKFPNEMEHYLYLPVVFSPPRDGKQLTEPLPVGHNKFQSMTMTMSIPVGPHNSSSSSRQSSSVDGDDVDGVSEGLLVSDDTRG